MRYETYLTDEDRRVLESGGPDAVRTATDTLDRFHDDCEALIHDVLGFIERTRIDLREPVTQTDCIEARTRLARLASALASPDRAAAFRRLTL